MADVLVQEVLDAMRESVEFHDSGLTDIQVTATWYALCATVRGVPDALFGLRNMTADAGETLLTFYWVRGGVFGCMEVLKPADTDSSAPATRGWLRPLAGLRKVDVEAEVYQPSRMLHSELGVKSKISLHWDDSGKPAVVLDATGSMNTSARPPLEKLIELVLDGVAQTAPSAGRPQ
ncbi:hypothetical protein [[Mycobacterium] wendilense]|uniref:Uncharacterized protein n=1 Tax=[Mycobacterium] wendilense TaxID=3064284 RepID=A0ABN9NT68_9MYCO|nr:hypothetical protein [Mycolicibacterium sp. MU0050]CAJ1578975.1 hypothetical protein MU0050_000274 [Mycolicibacterium sp. MU0050]